MIISDLRNSRIRRLPQIHEFRPFVKTQVNSPLLQGMQRGKEIFNYTFRIVTLFISQLTKGIMQTGNLNIVDLRTGVIHGSLNQTIKDFTSLALFPIRQFTYGFMHDRVLHQEDDVLFKIITHRYSFVCRICSQKVRGFIYKKSVGTIYPCLHKVSARNPPRTQVIAPRPIEYITRSYIQKMRETRHLLLFVKKISRFFMKIAINNRSQ